MKKFLITIISIIVCIMPITACASEYTKDECLSKITEAENIQYHAHNMAESARALGWTNDSDLIKDLSNRWFTAYEQQTTFQTELDKIIEEEKKVEEEAKKQYVGEFKLTGYCPCYSCSEGYGTQTASGARATEGITVAADTRILPLGTKIYIEGVGERIVQDVGSAVKNKKIDIFVSNHSACYTPAYNTTAKVYIIK